MSAGGRRVAVVQIGFSVRLPVDAHSVPFIRGLCRQALEHLQVDQLSVHEIVLALSEACANVVQHAGPHDDYEVEIDIRDDVCRISVIDSGQGFDPAQVAGSGPRSVLDDGSGLLLMRSLVDDLDFRLDPDGRHRVTFEKHLGLASRSPVATA
jgi:anti-sigma regulatory factor (Ser/Thr protein kinase)